MEDIHDLVNFVVQVGENSHSLDKVIPVFFRLDVDDVEEAKVLLEVLKSPKLYHLSHLNQRVIDVGRPIAKNVEFRFLGHVGELVEVADVLLVVLLIEGL